MLHKIHLTEILFTYFLILEGKQQQHQQQIETSHTDALDKQHDTNKQQQQDIL